MLRLQSRLLPPSLLPALATPTQTRLLTTRLLTTRLLTTRLLTTQKPAAPITTADFLEPELPTFSPPSRRREAPVQQKQSKPKKPKKPKPPTRTVFVRPDPKTLSPKFVPPPLRRGVSVAADQDDGGYDLPALGWHVHRTAGKNLPVYDRLKPSGRCELRVQHIEGDAKELMENMIIALDLEREKVSIKWPQEHIIVRSKKVGFCMILEWQ